MDYQAIVITGTRGCKKTTIAQKICENPSFTFIKAVTTRNVVEEDDEGQHVHLSRDEFEKTKMDKLLIKIDFENDYYGITHEAWKEATKVSKTPLLVMAPEAIRELQSNGNEKLGSFFTIFLDAPDYFLNRQIENLEDINEIRDKERQFAADCCYVIGNNRDYDKTAELILNLWAFRKTGGLLSQRIIKLMIVSGMLLNQAEIRNATAAAFDLTLDDEYYHKGEIRTLSEKSSFIKMEPGDYALVGSKEIACFPRDIAGRFGLSVSLFTQGIILSNGPQIDPGFNGRLYCLLFNTSSEEVQLKRGQHFATLEFTKLLEPTIAYSGKYQGKNSLSEYLQRSVKSSAIGELRKDINGLKKEKWWIKIIPLTFSTISIIIAVVALLKALLGW